MVEVTVGKEDGIRSKALFLKESDEFLEYLQKSVEINPREAKLVLGFLFPEGMEPSEYVANAKQRLNK